MAKAEPEDRLFVAKFYHGAVDGRKNIGDKYHLYFNSDIKFMNPKTFFKWEKLILARGEV